MYNQPVMRVERFNANEFVASCETISTFEAKCDAPNGRLYEDTNKNKVWDLGDKLIDNSWPNCGMKHTFTSDNMKDGFVVKGLSSQHVWIWKDKPNSLVWHATVNPPEFVSESKNMS